MHASISHTHTSQDAHQPLPVPKSHHVKYVRSCVLRLCGTCETELSTSSHGLQTVLWAIKMHKLTVMRPCCHIGLDSHGESQMLIVIGVHAVQFLQAGSATGTTGPVCDRASPRGERLPHQNLGTGQALHAVSHEDIGKRHTMIYPGGMHGTTCIA